MRLIFTSLTDSTHWGLASIPLIVLVLEGGILDWLYDYSGLSSTLEGAYREPSPISRSSGPLLVKASVRTPVSAQLVSDPHTGCAVNTQH